MSEPSLIEWLQCPYGWQVPFTNPGPWLPENPTKLNVLAALIAMNQGNTRVTSWGAWSGGGVCGKIGLSQDEAIAMIALTCFVDGWLEATNGREDAQLGEVLKAEYDRMRSVQPVEDSPP